ncbi:hypothetical protein F3Y22_tig00110847pilonHSYRG00225 [Hibiscus syriacus]|uniref:Uncharacterized protein n=1 Tax=Hibiscus syriacus TaxID=106335 RepID=A0A6A2ZK64_HIBSY|nr:hypothetical protein F3Y22_tig00110847pilonHSYRG00225 [Hibiscus syriacus]
MGGRLKLCPSLAGLPQLNRDPPHPEHRPPSIDAGPNQCFWHADPKDNFSVKSAYASFDKLNWGEKDHHWLDELLTNQVHCVRHIGSDSSCSICNAPSETLVHILRDCPPSRQIWNNLVIRYNIHTFFEDPLDFWILHNVQACFPCAETNDSWSIFFASMFWHLWKRRSTYVFQQTLLDMDTTLHTSISCSRCYTDIFTRAERRVIRDSIQIKWNPPDEGWITMNTDGALSHDTRQSSVGDLFRNTTGECLLAFHMNIDISSILEAELGGIPEGLKLT